MGDKLDTPLVPPGLPAARFPATRMSWPVIHEKKPGERVLCLFIPASEYFAPIGQRALCRAKNPHRDVLDPRDYRPIHFRTIYEFWSKALQLGAAGAQKEVVNPAYLKYAANHGPKQEAFERLSVNPAYENVNLGTAPANVPNEFIYVDSITFIEKYTDQTSAEVEKVDIYVQALVRTWRPGMDLMEVYSARNIVGYAYIFVARDPEFTFPQAAQFMVKENLEKVRKQEEFSSKGVKFDRRKIKYGLALSGDMKGYEDILNIEHYYSRVVETYANMHSKAGLHSAPSSEYSTEVFSLNNFRTLCQFYGVCREQCEQGVALGPAPVLHEPAPPAADAMDAERDGFLDVHGSEPGAPDLSEAFEEDVDAGVPEPVQQAEFSLAVSECTAQLRTAEVDPSFWGRKLWPWEAYMQRVVLRDPFRVHTIAELREHRTKTLAETEAYGSLPLPSLSQTEGDEPLPHERSSKVYEPLMRDVLRTKETVYEISEKMYEDATRILGPNAVGRAKQSAVRFANMCKLWAEADESNYREVKRERERVQAWRQEQYKLDQEEPTAAPRWVGKAPPPPGAAPNWRPPQYPDPMQQWLARLDEVARTFGPEVLDGADVSRLKNAWEEANVKHRRLKKVMHEDTCRWLNADNTDLPDVLRALFAWGEHEDHVVRCVPSTIDVQLSPFDNMLAEASHLFALSHSIAGSMSVMVQSYVGVFDHVNMVSGLHFNLMMHGIPGVGKSLLMKALQQSLVKGSYYWDTLGGSRLSSIFDKTQAYAIKFTDEVDPVMTRPRSKLSPQDAAKITLALESLTAGQTIYNMTRQFANAATGTTSYRSVRVFTRSATCHVAGSNANLEDDALRSRYHVHSMRLPSSDASSAIKFGSFLRQNVVLDLRQRLVTLGATMQYINVWARQLMAIGAMPEPSVEMRNVQMARGMERLWSFGTRRSLDPRTKKLNDNFHMSAMILYAIRCLISESSPVRPFVLTDDGNLVAAPMLFSTTTASAMAPYLRDNESVVIYTAMTAFHDLVDPLHFVVYGVLLRHYVQGAVLSAASLSKWVRYAGIMKTLVMPKAVEVDTLNRPLYFLHSNPRSNPEDMRQVYAYGDVATLVDWREAGYSDADLQEVARLRALRAELSGAEAVGADAASLAALKERVRALDTRLEAVHAAAHAKVESNYLHSAFHRLYATEQQMRAVHSAATQNLAREREAVGRAAGAVDDDSARSGPMSPEPVSVASDDDDDENSNEMPFPLRTGFGLGTRVGINSLFPAPTVAPRVRRNAGTIDRDDYRLTYKGTSKSITTVHPDVLAIIPDPPTVPLLTTPARAPHAQHTQGGGRVPPDPLGVAAVGADTKPIEMYESDESHYDPNYLLLTAGPSDLADDLKRRLRADTTIGWTGSDESIKTLLHSLQRTTVRVQPLRKIPKTSVNMATFSSEDYAELFLLENLEACPERDMPVIRVGHRTTEQGVKTCLYILAPLVVVTEDRLCRRYLGIFDHKHARERSVALGPSQEGHSAALAFHRIRRTDEEIRYNRTGHDSRVNSQVAQRLQSFSLEQSTRQTILPRTSKYYRYERESGSMLRNIHITGDIERQMSAEYCAKYGYTDASLPENVEKLAEELRRSNPAASAALELFDRSYQELVREGASLRNDREFMNETDDADLMNLDDAPGASA